MDSNTQNHLYDPNHVSSSSGSGLLRFRSAPSSVLAASVDDNDETVFNSNEFENKSPASYAASPPPQQEPSSFLGLPPHYPKQSNGMMMMNTIGLDQFLSMNNHHHTRPAESHLLRQSSSPAGMFTNLSDQNGYGYVGEEEEEEESPSLPNGLRRHSSLSSRPPSSLGMFSQIPEIDSESVQFSHWNDPSSFIDNLSSLKRETENDGKLFHGAQIMSHRLSLAKSASDVGSVDKYLQLQDSVPCKVRAKRGCATHPRSIAERVRRTKISERMRKLQELVPNMDKQTNTSDMLDLAVDYIKDLQRQYKILNENRANCKCVNKEKNLI
ncbi:hypothetical protein Bca4012_028595 [Brassica carinata]|uniref:BnaC04g02580D protein n=5 Tax=Brassica TaxID=3705 RepID=A0A078IWX3_BRANA|nr:PREDICTED: transcription factor bHLH130-like [Brassica oleracea var. oleracea]XP_013727781.1 transcription factor bHLH130 [Brassica napus]KAG2290337.1 hypothetical protein Bca52824_049941 [Brassica carinata]CAA8287040.1 Unknown [Brassica oleracea]KAH0882096.1 hypothetical protein HID58_058192 [Brassica napus]CAA8287311.1 Unknown [Brassica napus]CAA8391626.1 Unknown [Brassica oleracea]